MELPRPLIRPNQSSSKNRQRFFCHVQEFFERRCNGFTGEAAFGADHAALFGKDDKDLGVVHECPQPTCPQLEQKRLVLIGVQSETGTLQTLSSPIITTFAVSLRFTIT